MFDQSDTDNANQIHQRRQLFHRLRDKFSFGKPIESKTGCLLTELGPVDFTEDLILGFDMETSPTTRAEAQKILLEAGRRAAMLTAYIAAEQGFTLDELTKIEPGYSHRTDPREVMAACGRLAGSTNQRIIGILADSVVQDETLLVKASYDYERYIVSNQHKLLEGTTDASEYNLEYARKILQGYDPEKTASGQLYSLHYENVGLPKNSTLPVDVILQAIGEINFRSLEKRYGTEGQTFLEKYSSGVIIRLDQKCSIEIVNGCNVPLYAYHRSGRNIEVRRVITENGNRMVVAYMHLILRPNEVPFHFRSVIEVAPDFTQPLEPAARRKIMVGLAHADWGSK